jgi:hypothetical protein
MAAEDIEYKLRDRERYWLRYASADLEDALETRANLASVGKTLALKRLRLVTFHGF